MPDPVVETPKVETPVVPPVAPAETPKVETPGEDGAVAPGPPPTVSP